MITGPANVPSDWNRRGPHRPALSGAEVARLRRARLSGVKARALADVFGVSVRTIYRAERASYGPRHCQTCRCQE